MQTINGIRNSLAALWQKPLWQKTVNVTYVACRALQEVASKNWASAVATGRLCAQRVSKNPMPVVVIFAGCILIPSVVALVARCCRRHKQPNPNPKPAPEAAPAGDAARPSEPVTREAPAESSAAEPFSLATHAPQPVPVSYGMADPGRSAVISDAPEVLQITAIPSRPASDSLVASVTVLDILRERNTQPSIIIPAPDQPKIVTATPEQPQVINAAENLPVRVLPTITPVEVQTEKVAEVATTVLVSTLSNPVNPEPIVNSTVSTVATAEQVAVVATATLALPTAQETKQEAAEKPRARSPLKAPRVVDGQAAKDRFRPPLHPPSSPRHRPLDPQHEAELKAVVAEKRRRKGLGNVKTAKPAINRVDIITLRRGAIQEFDTVVEGLSKAKPKEKDTSEQAAVQRFVKLINQGHVPKSNSNTAKIVRELLDKYANGDALHKGAANYFRMVTEGQTAGVPTDELRKIQFEGFLWMQIAVMKHNVKKDLGRFGDLLLSAGLDKIFQEIYVKILEEADKGSDELGEASYAIGCDFIKKNNLTKAKAYLSKAKEKGNSKAKESLDGLLKREHQENQEKYNNFLKRFREAPPGEEGLAQKEGVARDLAKFFLEKGFYPKILERESLNILKQCETLAETNARPKHLIALCHQAQLNVGSTFYKLARYRENSAERIQLLGEAVCWFEQPILRMIEEEEMVKLNAAGEEIAVSRNNAVDQFAKAILWTVEIPEEQRKILWTLIENDKEKNLPPLLAVAKGLFYIAKLEAIQFQSIPPEQTQQCLKEQNELLNQALLNFNESRNGVVKLNQAVIDVINTFVSNIEKEQKGASEYEALISKTTTVDDCERLSKCLQTYCPRAWDFRAVAVLRNGVEKAWESKRFESAKQFVKTLEDIGHKFYELAQIQTDPQIKQIYFGVAAKWFRYPQVVLSEQRFKGIPDRDAAGYFAKSVIQWASMRPKDREKLTGKFDIDRTNHKVWRNLFDNAYGLWYLQSHEKDLARAKVYFNAAAMQGSKFAKKQVAELAKLSPVIQDEKAQDAA